MGVAGISLLEHECAGRGHLYCRSYLSVYRHLDGLATSHRSGGQQCRDDGPSGADARDPSRQPERAYRPGFATAGRDASARGSRPRSNPRPRLGDPSPILDFGTDPLGAAQGVLPAPRAHRQPAPNRSLGRPALGIDGPHCRPTAVVTARPRGSRDGASVLAMGTYRPRGPVDPVETGRRLALSRVSNGQQVI